MFIRIRSEASRFITEESGQGITEYGSILAWVSVMVALTFSLSNGQLLKGVTGAYNAVVNLMNTMSSYSSGPPPAAPPAP